MRLREPHWEMSTSGGDDYNPEDIGHQTDESTVQVVVTPNFVFGFKYPLLRSALPA